MTANADARAAHEHGLAEFLVPERRARFRESLADPRRRAKLLGEFAHYEHRLDPRFATPHPPTTKHAAHVQQLAQLLVEAGARRPVSPSPTPSSTAARRRSPPPSPT